ncbi:MAG TPA: hypothetical protein VKB50_00655 [Vicinamibacterales bacterium]|nr:hypothetical protein [Vicinamibacterales bacterium]
MGTYINVAPWVVVAVIVFSVWRAFHGPYSAENWKAFTQWLGQRVPRKR